jgi:hypothetical protein
MSLSERRLLAQKHYLLDAWQSLMRGNRSGLNFDNGRDPLSKRTGSSITDGIGPASGGNAVKGPLMVPSMGQNRQMIEAVRGYKYETLRLVISTDASGPV